MASSHNLLTLGRGSEVEPQKGRKKETPNCQKDAPLETDRPSDRLSESRSIARDESRLSQERRRQRGRHRCAAAGLAAAEFGERAERAAAAAAGSGGEMHTENDGGDEMERNGSEGDTWLGTRGEGRARGLGYTRRPAAARVP